MAAWIKKGTWVMGAAVVSLVIGTGSARAIEVKLSPEEAQKALEAGRQPMDKANTPEDVKKVLQHAALMTRVRSRP